METIQLNPCASKKKINHMPVLVRANPRVEGARGGDARRIGTASEERARRLEQLETALLEGKISEPTYRELKRKYEGGG